MFFISSTQVGQTPEYCIVTDWFLIGIYGTSYEHISSEIAAGS